MTRRSCPLACASGLVCAILIVGGVLFPPSPLRLTPCDAQAVPVDELRRKQETQQRAAELARELVLDLLDIQLQQLEENGLTERPLYQDVKTMRQNIDGLIDAEMSDVVTLLLKAQADQSEKRDESFLEARRKIGEVLARLLAERQNLSRRLRTAEVAAQVRRLIDMESVVREVTISLPTQALRQQELQQLSTLADQRDARKLYDKLVETLVEARGWGGEVGRTAVEGLALLKAADTALHFDEAAGSIEMGRFAAAVEHETAAIRGLQVLLKKVKETQGLIQADHRAALEVVRDLMRRQESLLAETKTAPLDDPMAAENLLKKQTALGKDLERLNEMVLDKPSAAPLVERAQKASEKATVELFNQKAADAAQQQNTVRANLAAVEKQLEDAAADDMPQERDAAQLAQRTADLEATREALKQARAQVQPVAEAESPPTPAAKAPLEQAAKDISRAGQSRDLPRMVDARLRDVVRTAREAAKSIDDPLRDDGAKKQEIQKADAALEQAQAEVEAALADVKRMQPAVAAAELSRAAEALDRAAAAEREIARRANAQAKQAEAKKPAAEVDAAAAKELAEEQERVVGVTGAVQEAVAKEAPEAAQPLAEAKAAAENAAMQLAGKEPTKPPAAAELKAAAAQANTAAQKLASAASALRRQAAQKAQNLAKETEKQLAALRPAMQAVDQAAMPPTQPNGEAQLALAAAEQALDKAEAEQMRAAGKAEAAAARELADQVEALEQMQQSAASAAKDHNQGREETPLEAVTKQQETADEIERLAAQAAARPQAKQAAGELKPDPLGDKLAAARKNAQEAAKLTLDGKEPEAQAARKEAAEALAEAAAMAKAEAAEAAKQPAAKPDAAAQERVSAAIAEAKKNALGHAPLSREPLEKAEEASNDATAMAGAEAQAAEAAKSQEDAAKNIAQAKKAVEQAQAALAAQGKQRAQQQAAAADKLAQQAAQLDPGATEALREAQQAAADGASMPAEPAAAQAAKSEKQTAQALQRAGAELAAREQMVKRDQQLAQAMLNSLAQQQQATQDIAAQRAALQQAMAGKPATSPAPAQGQAQAAAPTPPPPAGPEAEAAARNLNSAMQNFAQAAQVTGQAAQEVAGQSETANTALAQALEQASNFTTPAGANPPPAGEMQAPTAAAQVPLPPQQPEVPVPPQSQLGQTSPEAGELPKTTQMGKGLAPTTPEATAQMMAGPQALEQLAQVETSSSPPKSGSAPGNVATAPSQQATKGQPGPSGKQAQQHSELSSQFAQATESSQPSVNNTGRNAADIAVNGNRPKGDEPWMAKLPAELRAAIRAEAQRPAPRGYEERLRNYFKNVE